MLLSRVRVGIDGNFLKLKKSRAVGKQTQKKRSVEKPETQDFFVRPYMRMF